MFTKQLLIMKIFGITGGIGSGKSAVADAFRKHDIPVYNSDIEAKKLMNSDTELMREMIAEFGNESYKNGELNRGYVASVVFDNKKALSKLNAIVHPAVVRDFMLWTKTQECDAVGVESALLVESGLIDHIDTVVVVTAPIDVRVERVMKRDGATREEVMGRISAQISEKKLLEYADYIVENSEGRDKVLKQVELIMHNK